MDDDDFWETYIPATPDEDRDFRGCGCLIAAAALVILLVLAATALGFEGRVVRVTDGDTLTVLRGSTPVKVRLEGIDAPERRQPFGTKATKALAAMTFNRTVRVDVTGRDKYGRTLGDVYAGGSWVNHELVRLGWAWHYRQYSKSETLARAERLAREARAGLWADPKPIPPWQFRKRKQPRRNQPRRIKTTAS